VSRRSGSPDFEQPPEVVPDSVTVVDHQLSTRERRLDALAKALIWLEILTIALLFASGRLFGSTWGYVAVSGVLMLLGCLGLTLRHRIAQRDRRSPRLLDLGVTSALVILLPPVAVLAILPGISGFASLQ
jgi:hypothetical protein